MEAIDGHLAAYKQRMQGSEAQAAQLRTELEAALAAGSKAAAELAQVSSELRHSRQAEASARSEAEQCQEQCSSLQVRGWLPGG
jgi:hypothetical protein